MNESSNPSTFGKEVEIIRQRFFIDHTSDLQSHFKEEYTLRCLTVNEKGIDNIFIKSPKLLPNLKIFDSNNTQLALITNKLTKALINNLLKHTEADNVKQELSSLMNDISSQQIFLLWIKLPADRRLMPKEARVITLEYDLPKIETNNKEKILEFHSAPYEVFYTITKPNDYDFNNTEFEIFDTDGLSLKNPKHTWRKKSEKGDPFYFNDNQQSVSIRVNPNIDAFIRFTYSFQAKRSIVALPTLSLYLLIGASIILLLANLDYYISNCSQIKICMPSLFQDKQAEIVIGIIGGSLIIPNLINNSDIRNSLRFWFIAPLAIAIFSIFV